MRRAPNVRFIDRAYCPDERPIQEAEHMIRRENRRSPAAVSDTELGIAALLLLVVVVLAVAFVPAFV
jgi:hypothetical protein